MRRCHQCGFRSDVAETFRPAESGLLGRDVEVCFACSEPGRDPIDRLYLRGWIHRLIWSLVLTFFCCQVAGLWAGLAAGAVLLLGRPVWTLIHEAAHALAAWAVGLPVTAVTVGRGPEIGAWRLGGARWTLRRYPFLGGETAMISPGAAAPWRNGLVYAAGPLVNLATAAVLVVMALALPNASGWRDPLILSILLAAIAANTQMAFDALRPAVGADGQPTDGAQILALCKPPASPSHPRLDLAVSTQTLQRAGRFAEAADLFAGQLAAHPNDPHLLGMVIHCTSRAAGDRAALDRYAALVAQAAHGPPRYVDGHQVMVGWLAANIAWSTIKSGADADLDVADRELQVALEHQPDAPEIKATLGALYVSRGESALGAGLLIDALRVVEDPIDRADFCLYVAKARRDQGDAIGAADADRMRAHILAQAFVQTA